MTGVLLLIVAAGFLGASALAWTGRWHKWSRRVLTGPLPMPITLLPGLGLACVATGLYKLGAPMAVAAPFFVAFLASYVVYLCGDPGEGPLLGGTKAQPQPAGRGLLVRRGERPVLIQTAFSPPTPGPGAAASAPWTSDRAGDPLT
jgi:hypothetical protein